jgi:hypothetical protein
LCISISFIGCCPVILSAVTANTDEIDTNKTKTAIKNFFITLITYK